MENNPKTAGIENAENKSGWKKHGRPILIALSATLLAFVLIVFCVGAWFYADLRDDITITQEQIDEARVSGTELEKLDAEYAMPTEETSPTDSPQDEIPEDYIVSTEDVSIILLVGSDSREGISAGARSDSMMLMAIDRAHKKIKLISIMRDLYAQIPGFSDNRFNAAFYFDGLYKNLDLKTTFRAIKKNLGVSAEDFVIVDFNGFREIVDVLGGVTIEVSEEEARYMCSDRKYGLFPRFEAGAGEYHMDGAETLNYCRMRKVGSGDFTRTERQRKVLSKIADQLKGAGILDVFGVVRSCKDYIMTNLSPEEINGYVMESPELLSYEIVQMQIPVSGAYWYVRIYRDETHYSSVLWTNYKWTANAIYDFIYEDDMTYANGGRAYDVWIPPLPSDVMTSPPTTSPSDLETETTASSTDVGTSSVTETTTNTSLAPGTEATTNSTSETTAATEATTQPPTTAASQTTVPPTTQTDIS